MLSDYQYIPDWARNTFGQQSAEVAQEKFLDELFEFGVAKFVPELDEDELVDVFITLITYADRRFGLEAFDRMISTKMSINYERTWSVDERGKAQHVDEP